MAPPAGTLRVGRYFAALLVVLGLLYLVAFFPGQRHTPKLGIDLVGGIRVIFTAQTPKGSPPPTSNQMTEARQIIEDRINTTGVTGATVVVQGSDQLVVEIPDATNTDIQRLGSAATLNFRGLMGPAAVLTCSPNAKPGTGGSPTTAPSPGANPSAGNGPSSTGGASGGADAPNDAGHHALPAASRTATSPASSTAPASTSPVSSPPASSGSGTPASTPATPTPSATSSAPKAQTVRQCFANPMAAIQAGIKAHALTLTQSDLAGLKAGLPNSESCPSPTAIVDNNGKPVPCKAFTSLSSAQKSALAYAQAHYRCSAGQAELDDAGSAYIACYQPTPGQRTTGRQVYLLGHVIVKGTQIASASAQAPNTSGTGGSANWTVALTLGDTGANNWHAWTSKYHTATAPATGITGCGSTTAPCSDFVGFTLDGVVISAPYTAAVLDTNTEISGGNPAFTQTTADALAQQLNYGKLPVTFRADQHLQVSATLGSAQLKGAFLAGGIGLVLVVLYSLLYYRGLGLVTIASLIVSAGLTYAMLVILGTQIGFTLDLSGIAGFIVALGITADSFVVFFERLKDEVHDGRSARVAVPRAWVRARRTILSADTVSFLAAAILYYFASADVKGFAFTLGLSTILDLIVVFLFTHPLVSLLSRSAAFGSKRFTGLDTVRTGGILPDEPAPSRGRRTGKTSLRKSAEAPAVRDESARSAIAVDEPEPEPTDDVTPDAGPTDTDGVVDEAGEARPRRRTTPEPGSAAERAAARRARMRQHRDEGEGDDR